MLITLLTDFGTDSHYVASMKGVMLSICHDAAITDITHNIAPGDIEEAAFILSRTYSLFPPGTIHTVVVDPGVGTERKLLIVRTEDYFFVAPDNGILSYIFHDHESAKVFHADNKNFWRNKISSTFHGRDIFAPVAAHLASGIDINKLGTIIAEYNKGTLPEIKITERQITGSVIFIDRFGNCITNIPAGLIKNKKVSIHIKNLFIDRLSTTFASVGNNSILAYIGSSEMLEIGINSGSAADDLEITKGTEVNIQIMKEG
ncbi:SAM-dependent chlorinase/fluorinase [bacterium]|nr:SAM-dependent chlorinase/fluorinase [bacterium]